MKNKYLVIPNRNLKKKREHVDFLFPLKGFRVGFLKTYDCSEIPDGSYIYINRILDEKAMESLPSLENFLIRMKGIVFEDLGIFQFLKEKEILLETILYATHASCSVYTIKTYLKFVDSVVISPDITKEEIQNIIKEIKKPITLYTYGPLPYLYSRRTLLKNYQENFKLSSKKKEDLEESTTKKKFIMVENEFGTVCYDRYTYDGRIFLDYPVYFHILNLSFEEIEDIDEWLTIFESKKELPNTTSGFLNQKTIYRLPPRKDSI